jgi:Methyltransferase domain
MQEWTLDSHVTIVETNAPNRHSGLMKAALNAAILGQGKLTDADVLAVEGMSGRKYRLFINNLIGSMTDPRYLEVGVWQGSTLCSAIYKNKVRALAIDNWSQFGGPADKFFSNLATFKGEAMVSIIEDNFRNVDFSAFGKFNIYLYDGQHREIDQYDAVNLALPALDDQFVMVMDDWNWARVRNGTMRALASVGVQLDFVTEIRTTIDESPPKPQGKNSDWHNGYFLASCSKAST